MQISFVRSGGFGYPLRKAIKGTIDLKNDAAEVSSGAAYHRSLAPQEAEQLRTSIDPVELDKASKQIASNRKGGAADLDDYHITITAKDGQSHDVHLSMSPDSHELQGVSPDVANLLRWIQHEAQKIKTHSANAS